MSQLTLFWLFSVVALSCKFSKWSLSLLVLLESWALSLAFLSSSFHSIQGLSVLFTSFILTILAGSAVLGLTLLTFSLRSSSQASLQTGSQLL